MNKIAEIYLTILKQTMLAHGFAADPYRCIGETYIQQTDYFGEARVEAVTSVLHDDWAEHNPLPGVGAHKRNTHISATPNDVLWEELKALAGVSESTYIKVFLDTSGAGIRLKHGSLGNTQMLRVASWTEFRDARVEVFGK